MIILGLFSTVLSKKAGTQKSLKEAILMPTHNIYFLWRNNKNYPRIISKYYLIPLSEYYYKMDRQESSLYTMADEQFLNLAYLRSFTLTHYLVLITYSTLQQLLHTHIKLRAVLVSLNMKHLKYLHFRYNTNFNSS